MLVEQKFMKVRELCELRATINLNPQWQRGAVWALRRQVLLIDSILRRMDIPKIYLLQCPTPTPFAYEAVDGQQRLRAIWAFADGGLILDHGEILPDVDEVAIYNRNLSTLDGSLRERFLEFSVCVAEIRDSSYDEVRQLFMRLQMGVALNPAELRNATGGPVRHIVDTIAETHEFFLESKISDKRYKRVDYLAHVFAMVALDGKTDLKAKNIAAVYNVDAERSDEILSWASAINTALDTLAEVNRQVEFGIRLKWIFVDLMWLILSLQASGLVVDPARVAERYRHFEAQRRQHLSAPEALLEEGRSALDRHLYDYIQAFEKAGATQAHIVARAQGLRAFFADVGGLP